MRNSCPERRPLERLLIKVAVEGKELTPREKARIVSLASHWKSCGIGENLIELQSRGFTFEYDSEGGQYPCNETLHRLGMDLLHYAKNEHFQAAYTAYQEITNFNEVTGRG